MIVDSSAIVGIALNQPEAAWVGPVLLADPAPRISAGNLLETYMVIDRRWGDEAAVVIARVVTPLKLIVEPVTEAQVTIARDAWRRYGRGSGHPARLNYGDCFAYARERDGPLLFIGNDFARPTSHRRWIRIPGPGKSAASPLASIWLTPAMLPRGGYCEICINALCRMLTSRRAAFTLRPCS